MRHYRHAFIIIVLLMVLAPCGAQEKKSADGSGRRLALVIGNAAYSAGRLQNPVNDARAIQTALQGLGFSVEATIDLNRKELAKAIDRFTARVHSGDVSLFYYSGHGLQIDGENYLIPVDFGGEDVTEVKYAAFAMSDIRNALDRSRARLKILIFDACRDNPFQGVRSTTRGLAKISGGPETFIAFATAPGMTASDGFGNGNSPFTSAILQVIRTPGLTLDDIFNRVNEIVNSATKGTQVPWHVSTVAEVFYFVPRATSFTARDSGAPTSSPSSPRVAINNRNSKKAQDAYNEGKRLFDADKYDEAIPKFTDAIRWDPTVATVFRYRAEAELALGHHDQAIGDFKLSVALDPKNASLITELGNAYLGQGAYQDAIDAFSMAVKLNPNLALAYTGLASTYFLLGEPKRVIEADARAIQLDPKIQGAHMSRSSAYAGFGQIELALEDISNEISLEREQSDAMGSYLLFLSYVSRAILYSQLGRQPDAIADLNQALTLKPNAGIVYVARGEVHKNIGDCTAAIPDLKKALALGDSPSGVEYPTEYNIAVAMPTPAKLMSLISKEATYVDLGECFATLGQLDEALSNSNEAIRIDPNPNTYNSRGWVYEKFGKHGEAVQDYDSALQLNPDFEVAYLNRGVVYEHAGNCARAIDNFSEAILLNPNNPWSFVDRSGCHQKMGEYRLAINDADTAIRLKPAFPEAFLDRGAAHAGLKEYSLAIADYNQAIQLKPDFGLAFNNRAKAKAASGDNKGAQDDLRRARDLGYTE